MEEKAEMDLEKKERNDGSYALDMDNKKISVTLSNGQHTILFEDIASTSFQNFSYERTIKAKQSAKTNIILFSSFIVGLVLMAKTKWWIGVAVIIIGFFAAGIKTDTKETVAWDNVTIETKGGKQVTYSVEMGQGKTDIDAIEKARRV